MRSEKQLAKAIIEKLQDNPSGYAGVCVALKWEVGFNYPVGLYMECFLPKLHKYLSKRNNHSYFADGSVDGRVLGNHPRYYWKPYHHTNRIKTLKKVYNIK